MSDARTVTVAAPNLAALHQSWQERIAAMVGPESQDYGTEHQ